MAYATFPSYKVDLGSSREKKPLELSTPFGDGYQQVSGDGINPFQEMWNVSFSVRPKADIDAIVAFLDARIAGGVGQRFFYWTAPDEASPKLWRLEQSGYRLSNPGGNNRSISFKLERVYA